MKVALLRKALFNVKRSILHFPFSILHYASYVRFIGQGMRYTVLVNKKQTHERKTHMEIRVTSRTVREGLLGMAKGFFYTSGAVAVLTLICRLVA